jgi:5-methyltetrahydrofolate--homocysteine methyltransferase
MVHIAKEMKRLKINKPLMIGGATTSRMHTAVKIAPEYDEGVVHVLDASRSVTVAGSLLSKEGKKDFLKSIQAEYEQLKNDFDTKRNTKKLISYSEATDNSLSIDWSNYAIPKPGFTGTKILEDVDLSEIATYIDWQPFFIAWEMHGKFPEILTDKIIGTEATKLYNDAQGLLQKIIEEKWLTARGVVGFWKARKKGVDTIELIHNDQPIQLEFLRQQSKKAAGQPNLSLADFIHPEKEDYVGAFSVTIEGIEKHIQTYYNLK